MPTASANGRELYYELHGPDPNQSSERPLVLVTGVGGSCKGWLPLQVPAFADARPVLIYDNRGVAGSPDDGEPFSIADLATDLRALLDAVGIAHADVLGSFMGAMVAQEFALLFPARVGRLVLAGTYARPDAKRRMLLQHWIHMIRDGATMRTLAWNRLLWTLHDDTLEQEDLIQGMVAAYTKDDPPVSMDLLTRQLEACLAHDTADRLSAIACPTLVIGGRHDLVTPTKMHREIADLIPDARLVTLAYGGHLVMVESAERFNQVVAQFLGE